MNNHHTKLKGDIGLTATIYDLTKRGYFVFTSISENCNYDLIAEYEGILYKIQAKYRGSNNQTINKTTHWSDKHGSHTKIYTDNAFDFFAVYLADIQKVVYIPFKENLDSFNIRTELPNTFTPFYWWEDFLELKKELPNKRTLHEFNITVTKRISWNKGKDNYKARKVVRPSKGELEKLVWSLPTEQLAKQLGVSGVAISKWCKKYNITKPPRGYWAKQRASS